MYILILKYLGKVMCSLVGLMNNLAREGASHNVHVNCLSPGAATRMTASVPGSEIDPDNPAEDNHPGLVSPAVLLMAGEEAPNGRIVQAAGGKFASDMVYANQGVDMGVDVDAEDVVANQDTILDMSSAEPKTTFWRI